jgi:hypothetical protein
MTAILLSSSDQGGFGLPRPPRERNSGRREDLRTGASNAVPPATAERPKSWVSRIIEAMTKPVEPNFHNP